MSEIAETISQKKVEADREKWRKLIWLGRRFAPLTDEEREIFADVLPFEEDKARPGATAEEAMEEVERIEEKFREHGTRKVNPYEGIEQ